MIVPALSNSLPVPEQQTQKIGLPMRGSQFILPILFARKKTLELRVTAVAKWL